MENHQGILGLSTKNLLHVGCGPKRKSQTTPGFNLPEWNEIRLDIDPKVQPDLLGTMVDMSAVGSGSINAIFSSHNIEHLYPFEVPIALKEFLRVLTPEGFLVLTCPDLQSVCQLVANDQLTDAAYVSPAGPIAPLDILYGFRQSLAKGDLYMAHRCGFTRKVLHGTLKAAGFQTVVTLVRPRHPFFDLWALASKSTLSKETVTAMAADHFPRS